VFIAVLLPHLLDLVRLQLALGTAINSLTAVVTYVCCTAGLPYRNTYVGVACLSCSACNSRSASTVAVQGASGVEWQVVMENSQAAL
jgi:hypothetical protein